MPRPVCGTCAREMTLSRVGVVVQLNAIVTAGAYEQWHGDEATCEGCGAVVVFRYGSRPTWQHFEKKFIAPEPASYVVEERPKV